MLTCPHCQRSFNPSDTTKMEPGERIMTLFVMDMVEQLEDPEKRALLKAADKELIRKFLSDSSVTLAHLRRGDFGEFAQSVAEAMPFDDDGAPTFN